MKSNEKKILIIIIICLVLCVILAIACKFFINQSKKKEAEENENVQGVGIEQAKQVKDTELYYMVDSCIKSYLTMLKNKDNSVIISYLNEEFINKNKINENNVLEIIKQYNNYDSYRTKDVYEKYELETRFATYCAKGKIDGSYIFFIVGVDPNNETFDIYPVDEETYNKTITEKESTNETQEKSIAKKTYNFYRNTKLSDEELCRFYYIDYIKLMLIDSEEAYNMLNEEYRNNKFGSIDNFKKYIQSFKNYYESIYKVETADSANFNAYADYYNFINDNSIYQMKNFAVNDYAEYKQCICGNITGSNTIFNIYYPGSYEVYLDSYTCDLSQFLEKYNKSSNENKVAMNLEKIKGALNTKDYRYIYNKLDDTFKKNKFDSVDKLKEYLKNNFFEYNSFDYQEVKQNGNLYTAKISVANTTGQSESSITLNAIMRIDDGTNFVMSFSIE